MGKGIIFNAAIAVFGLFLFFSAGTAKAAFSSNCDAGNINCNNTNDSVILQQQCVPAYGASFCNTMQDYLNEMQYDCQSKPQTGFDCTSITNTQNGTAYYGNNAAAFAATTSSNNNLNSGSAGSGIYIPSNTGLPDPAGGIKAILTNLLNWLLGIIGILAIISFIISGITYLISTGDEDIIDRAKRNMTYSIVGVIVALAGYVIIQAVDFMLRGQTF